MKPSLAIRISDQALDTPLIINTIRKNVDGTELEQAGRVIRRLTGIQLPKSLAGRRRAMRSIGCEIRSGRVYAVA